MVMGGWFWLEFYSTPFVFLRDTFMGGFIYFFPNTLNINAVISRIAFFSIPKNPWGVVGPQSLP